MDSFGGNCISWELHRSLVQVKTEVDGTPSLFAVGRHVGDLINVIQNDSSVGTSLASFLRMIIKERQNWLVSVGCVRGRLCEAPDSWGRDLFSTPPSAAECNPNFLTAFESGSPLHFRFENSRVFFSQ